VREVLFTIKTFDFDFGAHLRAQGSFRSLDFPLQLAHGLLVASHITTSFGFVGTRKIIDDAVIEDGIVSTLKISPMARLGAFEYSGIDRIEIIPRPRT